MGVVAFREHDSNVHAFSSSCLRIVIQGIAMQGIARIVIVRVVIVVDAESRAVYISRRGTGIRI